MKHGNAPITLCVQFIEAANLDVRNDTIWLFRHFGDLCIIFCFYKSLETFAAKDIISKFEIFSYLYLISLKSKKVLQNCASEDLANRLFRTKIIW